MELKSIFKAFPNESDCLDLVSKIIWLGIPVCPYCNQSNTTPLKNRFHCNSCNNTFSPTVGNIFHRTRCDLRKWFLAIYLYQYSEVPMAARYLADKIDVTKDTAWLMLSKIRKANVSQSKLLNSIRDEIIKHTNEKDH